MTTTHPYPALPQPKVWPEVTWQQLLDEGCPRCGCDSFQEWSPCYGLHEIEINVDYDPDLDETTVSGVVAYYETHTDMDDGRVRCRNCDHYPDIIGERELPGGYEYA